MGRERKGEGGERGKGKERFIAVLHFPTSSRAIPIKFSFPVPMHSAFPFLKITEYKKYSS